MVTYAEYAPTVAYSFVLYFPPKKQKKHTLVTCSVLADFLSSASARQTNLSFGRWLLSNMWQLCIHCQDEYLVNLSPSATQSAIASALLGLLSPCAQLSRIPPKTSFLFIPDPSLDSLNSLNSLYHIKYIKKAVRVFAISNKCITFAALNV